MNRQTIQNRSQIHQTYHEKKHWLLFSYIDYCHHYHQHIWYVWWPYHWHCSWPSILFNWKINYNFHQSNRFAKKWMNDKKCVKIQRKKYLFQTNKFWPFHGKLKNNNNFLSKILSKWWWYNSRKEDTKKHQILCNITQEEHCFFFLIENYYFCCSGLSHSFIHSSNTISLWQEWCFPFFFGLIVNFILLYNNIQLRFYFFDPGIFFVVSRKLFHSNLIMMISWICIIHISRNKKKSWKSSNLAASLLKQTTIWRVFLFDSFWILMMNIYRSPKKSYSFIILNIKKI